MKRRLVVVLPPIRGRIKYLYVDISAINCQPVFSNRRDDGQNKGYQDGSSQLQLQVGALAGPCGFKYDSLRGMPYPQQPRSNREVLWRQNKGV